MSPEAHPGMYHTPDTRKLTGYMLFSFYLIHFVKILWTHEINFNFLNKPNNSRIETRLRAIFTLDMKNMCLVHHCERNL